MNGRTAFLCSIVIPSFGRPVFLREAVDSALSQTVDDVEVIVVDDASPEPIELPSHPRLRIVRMPVNSGPAAARNAGVEAARGGPVAFCDDDDRLTPQRVELGLRGLARAPLSVCAGRYFGASWRPGMLQERIFDGDMSLSLLEDHPPHMGQVMLDKRLFQPQREDLRTTEDYEWWIRMSTAGSFAFESEVGYEFRIHAEARDYDQAVRARNRALVMGIHADYFAARPRAASVQWSRVASAALLAGDRRAAVAAAGRSLRHRPSAVGGKLLLAAIQGRRT